MADPKNPTTTPEPRFTNVARVRHTDTEFYLEFGQLSLDQPGVASLVSLLVMTPQHAKSLATVLSSNVDLYESRHGEIKVPTSPKPDSMQ
jgi:hypothetical protein